MNVAGQEPAIHQGVLGKKSLRSFAYIDSRKTFEERRCTIYRTRFQYQKGQTVKTVPTGNIASVQQEAQYCILETKGAKTIVLEAGSVDEAGEWFAAFVTVGVRPADDGDGSGGDNLSTQTRRKVSVAAAALAWIGDDSATSARVASILLKHATVSGEAKATGQSMGLLLATLFLNPNSRLGTRPLSEQWLKALVRSELGLLDFTPTAASPTSSTSIETAESSTSNPSRTPHALLLRRESASTVALSTYLKLALQWGHLTHAVCGPLLQKAQQLMSSSSSGNANSSSSGGANVNEAVDEQLWPAVGDAVLRLEDVLTAVTNPPVNDRASGSSSSSVSKDRRDAEKEPISGFGSEDGSFEAAPHEAAAAHMIQAYLQAARDGAKARVIADSRDQVPAADRATAHEYFSALASGVVLRGLAPALLSPQHSGCAAPSSILVSSPSSPSSSSPLSPSASPLTNRSSRSSNSSSFSGDGDSAVVSRITDLNALEGLQALLGDPHAPFVLVYAGTSTATLERSQRMLVEHCLPLETFLKAQFAHPAALEAYSVVFVSRDGSTAFTARDNQKKHHKRQRCGTHSLMNAEVMQALSQYNRNWTQAKAAHLAHVALLSAPHTTSSESSALPPPPAPSSPVAEAKNGQTSRAEARRVLWYAAVDGSSTAAVTVLAHLLVRARGNNASSEEEELESPGPTEDNMAEGWGAILRLSGKKNLHGKSSFASLSLSEAAAQVDTFLTREAPSHYRGWAGGSDPNQPKSKSSTSGRAGAARATAGLRGSVNEKEKEYLASSSSSSSSLSVQRNDGGKRAAVLLQKVANGVSTAPEAAPQWVMPVVPLGERKTRGGSPLDGGGGSQGGSQSQVAVELSGQLRRCWRRAADSQEPLLEAELCLDDDEDDDDEDEDEFIDSTGRIGSKNTVDNSNSSSSSAGLLLGAVHDSMFGGSSVDHSSSNSRSSRNKRSPKPTARAARAVRDGGSSSSSSGASAPTSPLSFDLPGLDLDLGFELSSTFSSFAGVAASPNTLSGSKQSQKSSAPEPKVYGTL